MRVTTLRWIIPCLLIWLTACGSGNDHALSQQADMAPLPTPAHWSVFLLAGDNSAPVFDNAVTRFQGLLHGPSIGAIHSFSADGRVAGSDPATVDNLATAMDQLPPQADTGCFVFMTSHGNQDGVFLRADLKHQHFLTPTQLGNLLDATCGQRPTVAIISACHSGVFLDDAAPNRIILTAARADRTSFGCGAAFDYTYYDSCLLDHWPQSRTFVDLYNAVVLCVEDKERQMNVTPSQPQAWFGTAVATLPLPR